jgi:hypothetical protein
VRAATSDDGVIANDGERRKVWFLYVEVPTNKCPWLETRLSAMPVPHEIYFFNEAKALPISLTMLESSNYKLGL